MRRMKDKETVIDIEGAEKAITIERCIYKVPFPIRRVNEDAYTPALVSIGPFHHNSHPRLRNMETIKLKIFESFLAKTETPCDTWNRCIKKVERGVRSCYSDTLDFTPEKLVQIISVDSGFIFHLFLMTCYSDWPQDENDSLLLTPLWSNNIKLDLLLLENQLPFFVLDLLFNLSFGSKFQHVISFRQLTFDYFAYYNISNLKFNDTSINIRHFTDLLRTFHLQHPPQTPRTSKPPRTSDDTSINIIRHFTDLLRTFHLQHLLQCQIRPPSTSEPHRTSEEPPEPLRHLPSAADLSKAGVKFKVNTQSKCILDLQFSGRVLQIPLLNVRDKTEREFRNMMALEQCLYPDEAYISDYVFVLDFLINTREDVDILVRQNVLGNWLGDSDSVAKMINGLHKNHIQKNFNSHYSDLCRDLNAFYANRWNNLKSTLRRDYFKSPWQTAASIAGILLLFMTLVQTVCSVWQTIKQ